MPPRAADVHSILWAERHSLIRHDQNADNSITFNSLSVSVPGSCRFAVHRHGRDHQHVRLVQNRRRGGSAHSLLPVRRSSADPGQSRLGWDRISELQLLPVSAGLSDHSAQQSAVIRHQDGAANVTPPVFDPTDQIEEEAALSCFTQVPDSSKWWSSLMFPEARRPWEAQFRQIQRQRALADVRVPSRWLIPIRASPRRKLLCFAGIGLTHLTHLFVNPAL